MGGMPWDDPRPAPPPPPPPRPPVPPPPPPPVPAQQMLPDIPMVARNPQTGETVRVDVGDQLREAIRQAVTGAVAQNKDGLQANVQAAVSKLAQGQMPTLAPPVITCCPGTEIESTFQLGAATKRTFIQGMALDMAFAAMAVLMTVSSTDFNVADKEAWTVVGVMMLKTVLQTGMSFMMKLKAT